MSLAGTWTFTPSGAAATTITVPGGGWVAQGFRSVNHRTLPAHGDGPGPGARPGDVPRVRRHQPSGHPDRRQHDGGDPDDVVHAVGLRRHERRQAGDEPLVHRRRQRTQRAQGLERQEVGARRRRLVGRTCRRGSSGRPSCTSFPALHVFETLVRTDVAADQFSIDVWVKNDGASTANGTVDVALSSWTCDGTSYPTRPLDARLRRAGKTVKVTLGPVTWGLGSTLVLVAERPLRAGLPGQAARRARHGDAGRGRRWRGSRAFDPGSLRLPPEPPGRCALRAERRAHQVPRRQHPGRGLRQHQERRRKDSSDAYDLFPGLLAAVGQQPGLAAGRG